MATGTVLFEIQGRQIHITENVAIDSTGARVWETVGDPRRILWSFTALNHPFF